MNALSRTSLCLEVHSLKSALEMRVVTEKRTLKAKDRDYHGEKKNSFLFQSTLELFRAYLAGQVNNECMPNFPLQRVLQWQHGLILCDTRVV